MAVSGVGFIRIANNGCCRSLRCDRQCGNLVRTRQRENVSVRPCVLEFGRHLPCRAVGKSFSLRHCGQKATVGNNLGTAHIVAIEKHLNARYRLLVLEVLPQLTGRRGVGGTGEPLGRPKAKLLGG